MDACGRYQRRFGRVMRHASYMEAFEQYGYMLPKWRALDIEYPLVTPFARHTVSSTLPTKDWITPMISKNMMVPKLMSAIQLPFDVETTLSPWGGAIMTYCTAFSRSKNP